MMIILVPTSLIDGLQDASKDQTVDYTPSAPKNALSFIESVKVVHNYITYSPIHNGHSLTNLSLNRHVQ